MKALRALADSEGMKPNPCKGGCGKLTYFVWCAPLLPSRTRTEAGGRRGLLGVVSELPWSKC